jgi:hypothetical protein
MYTVCIATVGLALVAVAMRSGVVHYPKTLNHIPGQTAGSRVVSLAGLWWH